jgi:hypothetical protein
LVLMPKRINYHPFFAPEPHKLDCELHSKRVSYKSPSGAEATGGLDEILAYVESAIGAQGMKADSATPLIQERAACKYSLICGCRNGMDGIANDQKECAVVYEQRLRQVLPLLVFNLQQRKERAAASHG